MDAAAASTMILKTPVHGYHVAIRVPSTGRSGGHLVASMRASPVSYMCVLLLYIALPIVCILAVSGTGRGALADKIVRGLALYETLLLASGLLLGFLGILRPVPYAAVHVLLLGALSAWAWRRRAASPSLEVWRNVRRWIPTRRGGVAAALAAGVILLVGIQLAADAVLGTRQWDALGYHLPRSMIWAQQGSVSLFPTPSWHQLGIPIGANLVLGSKIFLGLGWAGGAYVTALLTVGAIASVFLAALDLGLGRWRAVLAAILFASFPAIGERVSSVSSDMAATFPVLAGYLFWTRARDSTKGLAAFLLLAGVGVACKSTVAPFVVVLGAAAGYRTWKSGRRWRLSWTVVSSAAIALGVTAGSFWPVYEAFGDLLGGPTGHAHAVHDGGTFIRSVLVNAVNWALEPLGYVPHAFRSWMPDLVRRAYSPLGVRFEADQFPFGVVDWAPWPSPDSGRTGALSIIAFAGIIPFLPRQARRVGLPLFALAFIALSGMLYYQPYSGRFTITLLAGYALLWASAAIFARPPRRRWLAAITACNLAAALAVTSYVTWRDFRLSSEGGTFDLLDERERIAIAESLDGEPLWVLSAGSLDALVPGPEVAFQFRYFVCPRDGDGTSAMARAAADAPGVALVHAGSGLLAAAPASPHEPSCPPIALEDARVALKQAGLTRFLARPGIDVWLWPAVDSNGKLGRAGR
jgi:hypothetical protein